VPSFLLGFGADARPAVFLIGKEVLCAFNIGDDACSSGFKGFCAGDDGSFNIDGTLDL
jgi:hypothetical protein